MNWTKVIEHRFTVYALKILGFSIKQFSVTFFRRIRSEEKQKKIVERQYQ